jgi:hypothetical protein
MPKMLKPKQIYNMKKYIILLKSGFYLKCSEKISFNEKGKMIEQEVEIHRNDGYEIGTSNDFYLHMDEISMHYWIS